MDANTDAPAHRSRVLTPGMYCPILTFFKPGSEDLDLETFEKHVLRVANQGISLVIAGTFGEAVHLSHEERRLLITTARNALDDAGLESTPIIAGTGALSTRETIQLCAQAASAGADACLVLPPGFFAGAMKADLSAIHKFYLDVADNSPIPVLLYNYPAVTGGIDLDSDFILDIAKSHRNVVGCKLTCGSVGKISRVAATTAIPSFGQNYPRKTNVPFLVLGGTSDYLLPSLICRASGSITGLANIAPRVVTELFRLSVRAISTCNTDDTTRAQDLQDIVANAENLIMKSGISGTKWALQSFFSYGGLARRPFNEFKPNQQLLDGLKEIIDLEISLS